MSVRDLNILIPFTSLGPLASKPLTGFWKIYSSSSLQVYLFEPFFFFKSLSLFEPIFAPPHIAEQSCSPCICAVKPVQEAVEASWKKRAKEKRERAQHRAEPAMMQLHRSFISWMKMSPMAPAHLLLFDRRRRAAGLGAPRYALRCCLQAGRQGRRMSIPCLSRFI